MNDSIVEQIAEHNRVMDAVAGQLAPEIDAVIDAVCTGLSAGKKVLVMGNGGSAADAQHFAAELIGRFKMERPSLPAIALTTDSSILTAIGNDYGYDAVFSRQVEGLASEGDIVFGISTSGNSPNVLSALKLAREKGCVTVSLLGRDGGSIRAVSDYPVVMPSNNTPRIQEGHIMIIHIICDLVEKRLFANR